MTKLGRFPSIIILLVEIGSEGRKLFNKKETHLVRMLCDRMREAHPCH
jgi:hypothetical protein